jgi:hypothetical protein
MMCFPRWFIPINIATLDSSCRVTGKYNRGQALKKPSELFCVKFEKRLGFLNLMSISNLV